MAVHMVQYTDTGKRARTYHQTTPCSILHNLRCNDRISDQSPKQGGHHSRMYCRKHDKRRTPLLQHSSRRQELQRQAECIDTQEIT
jgi:hypothetical protein